MAHVRPVLAKLKPKHKPIGKRDGNWFIRIPLWLQGTILIFLAGFLSLLVLTIVTGVKTWQYSEDLMRERLSNFAAMTALQIEENFSEIQNRVAAASSSQSLISVLNSVNNRGAQPSTWQSLEEQFDIQFNGFPSMNTFVLYNHNLRIVYTYQRRDAGSGLAAQQISYMPRFLLPLSNSSEQNTTLSRLSRYSGGVISNRIIPQWGTTINDPTNITFSVTRGVSKFYEDIYSPINHPEGYGVPNNSSDWVGQCTFMLTSPYSFPSNASPNLFESYQVLTVRKDQVGPKNFSFLIPFAIDGNELSNSLNWPTSDFPPVISAVALVDEVLRQQNATVSSRNASTFNTTSGTLDGSKADPTLDPLLYKRNHDSAARFNKENVPKIAGDILSRKGTVSNDTQGNLSGKQGRAIMRTRTPWDRKSSVGYSWANVMDEQWLIFVQISESEAFNPAVHLRNIVIGVGVGILGAIVLIMAPLSRWQTRGLYIIYQNMRLRPMFVAYDEGDAEEGEDSTGSENEKGPKPPGGAGKTLEIEGSKKCESNSTESTQSSSATLGNSMKDVEYHSMTATPEPKSGSKEVPRHHGRVPTTLPPLNRIYTDELDDLVHEYNNMVNKLNNQYLHLEDEVRLRTGEAQRARELTEQANNAKSEFIAIISHELRTPLNGIMGLTSVSVEDDDVENIKNSLALIIESGRVLMELLNELLELSKSLIGVDPFVRLFSPASLLESLPNMFQSRASDLSVTFSLAAVPSDIRNVTLRGDADHVVQICLNFMSNAMKFSERNGTVSVILHLRPYTDPYIHKEAYGDALKSANAVLEILVTDSGMGMSPSQLGKIFDLFVQGNDPLRKNHRGAGLGMALSKQLAEGIGGYVAVFSAEGVGSSVVLRVPVECVGRNAAEVEAMNGPPIEFKVKDVYTTLSCEAGEVNLVKQIHWQRESQDGRSQSVPPNLPISATSVPYPQSPSNRRSRHAHQSSSGSKMLLTRAYPVTRLLRSHHHQQPSHSTAHASMNSSRSGSATIDDHADLVSPAEAVTGQHKNASSSSLLLVVPPGMDEQGSLRPSRTSWYTTAEATPTPPSSVRDPSPTRILPVTTFSTQSAAPSTTTTSLSQSPTGHEMLVPQVSPPTSATDSPVVFVTSPEGTPVPAKIDPSAKILVAEDNALNSQIMVKMLKQIGLEDVSTASNGDDAIKMVEKSIVGGYHFAIIFMDISMPFVNGIEATQIIRTTLGYPYPIIALTGFSDADSRGAIMSVNIQEVLSKPVMKNDLLRVIQKYVGGRDTNDP